MCVILYINCAETLTLFIIIIIFNVTCYLYG